MQSGIRAIRYQFCYVNVTSTVPLGDRDERHALGPDDQGSRSSTALHPRLMTPLCRQRHSLLDRISNSSAELQRFGFDTPGWLRSKRRTFGLAQRQSTCPTKSLPKMRPLPAPRSQPLTVLCSRDQPCRMSKANSYKTKLTAIFSALMSPPSRRQPQSMRAVMGLLQTVSAPTMSLIGKP